MKRRKGNILTDVLIALFTMSAAMLVVGTVLYKKGLIKVKCCDDVEDVENLRSI